MQMKSDRYNKISSSSLGNCVIWNKEVMIDLGVPFSKIEEFIDDITIIFLTHRHGDHFNRATIQKVGREYPHIILAVPEYMIEDVRELDYQGRTIITNDSMRSRILGKYNLRTFPCFHDVPNMGFVFRSNELSWIHATDTGSIDHVTFAQGLDVYGLEFNHDEELIVQSIMNSEGFTHLIRSRETHLSFQKAEKFYLENRREDSELLMLHISSFYEE